MQRWVDWATEVVDGWPEDLRGAEPDPDAVGAIAALLAGASRTVLILGTDVWADHAEAAALRFVEDLGIPTLTNGMGRGLIPGGHPSLVTKARGAALSGADLVVVVGTPLDFRLGYGVFGGKDDTTAARVVHLADSAALTLPLTSAEGIQLGGPPVPPAVPLNPPGAPSRPAAPPVRRPARRRSPSKPPSGPTTGTSST